MRRERAASLAFCALFVVIAILSVAKVTYRAAHGTGDHFAYFRAAQRLMAGQDPYALTGDTYVYLYPPVWALLVWPLTVAGPVAFGVAWAVALGASWLAARRLVRRLVPGMEGWAAVVPDLWLARFLLSAWSSGQVTLPLSVVVLGGLALLVDGNVAGAALIGLASAIKVYPLLLAPVVWRLGGRRALGVMAAVATAVTLAPVAVVGGARFVALVRDGFLGIGLQNIESQRFWSGRCAPLPAAWHLAGGGLSPVLSALEAAWALGAMAVVAALYPGRDERLPLWMGFGVLSMLIATPMLGENYLAMMLLPVAALVAAGRGAALAVAAVLLNVHSPLVVGRAWCDPLERLGLSAIALTGLWLAMARELAPPLPKVAPAWQPAMAGVLLLACAAHAQPAYPAFERHTYTDATGVEHVFLLQRAPRGAAPAGLFIYCHGAGGFEEQGMSPEGYAGSFARLRTLLAQRGWAYACPRLPDFDSLLPELEKYFGKIRIVLSGASAGGRRAYREALVRPGRYAGVILLCPAIEADPAPVSLPAWISGGEVDRLTVGARALAANTKAAGVRCKLTVIPEGNHDAPLKQADWRAAMDYVLRK